MDRVIRTGLKVCSKFKRKILGSKNRLKQINHINMKMKELGREYGVGNPLVIANQRGKEHEKVEMGVQWLVGGHCEFVLCNGRVGYICPICKSFICRVEDEKGI